MPNVRKVEIQAYDHQSFEWKNIHLSEVKFNDDAIFIGGPFRLVVDGDTEFSTMKEDLDGV